MLKPAVHKPGILWEQNIHGRGYFGDVDVVCGLARLHMLGLAIHMPGILWGQDIQDRGSRRVVEIICRGGGGMLAIENELRRYSSEPEL